MLTDNFNRRIHREIIVRIAKAFWDGDLEDSVDRIPLLMRPKGGPFNRCCVYKDRALIRYRCMAVLGFGVEDEIDDAVPLRDFAVRALERDVVENPVITVIHEACSACVTAHYEVTVGCHGCVARPCQLNCPKKAIDFRAGKAVIDFNACVRCGLCMKVCPYHAIIRVPVPCEESCPVGAISKDESGRERIDYSKCVFCGKCVVSCPFGAVMEKSQIIDVLAAAAGPERLVAMIAPALMGQFKVGVGPIAGALRALGFADVVEVAVGADETSRLEADEFVSRMERGDRFMTSSCCYAYDEVVAKHVPELRDYISLTPTPMSLVAAQVKSRWPDSTAVFVGPCVAKRREAIDDENVDFVLTFEELDALFEAKGIRLDACESEGADGEARWLGRGFPVSGGTTKAIQAMVGERRAMNPALIDGLDAQNIKRLRSFAKSECPGDFIEVMACEGGCVGGPAVVADPRKATRRVADFAGASD